MDLNITRIGGLGLGNMLFTYARAVLYARDHEATLIWPTWNSIPVGQILRREPQKRYYNDLFETPHGMIGDLPVVTGWKKWWLRARLPKMREEILDLRKADADSLIHEEERIDLNKIIVFRGMEGEFQPILGKENSRYLFQHLESILQKQNQAALEFQPDDAIVMHVRLGDFKRGATIESLQQGAVNTSIPMTWYVNIVKEIRKASVDNRKVYVFSDGTDEELKSLLDLPNVERKTYGTAIADITAMSRAKLFIASGSTFSRWVRYLGRMNTITYPGQLGQKLLDGDGATFEIEVERELPLDIKL